MKRIMVMLYSIINYTLGVAALIYLIAFLFNLYAPKTIDSGEGGNLLFSVLINLGLISMFELQHSIMARPKFKKWLTSFIPKAAERSTFMLATAIIVFTLCMLWQPIPAVLWQANNDAIYNTLLGVGLTGWGLVLFSSYLINHYDLFGLRQAWLFLLGKEYTHLPFKNTLAV